MSEMQCGRPPQMAVDIPMELFQSSLGRYFIGYADHLKPGISMGAWARLYNPCDSGVNLHVNAWTVTDLGGVPFLAQFWFNARVPGDCETADATPVNFALPCPPERRVEVQFGRAAAYKPVGGVEAFFRRAAPGATLADSENGKLIFPPGGSFMIFLAFENRTPEAEGAVAFGWWEEPLPCCRIR